MNNRQQLDEDSMIPEIGDIIGSLFGHNWLLYDFVEYPNDVGQWKIFDFTSRTFQYYTTPFGRGIPGFFYKVA